MGSRSANYVPWTRYDGPTWETRVQPTGQSPFRIAQRGHGFAGQMNPLGSLLPHQRVNVRYERAVEGSTTVTERKAT